MAKAKSATVKDKKQSTLMSFIKKTEDKDKPKKAQKEKQVVVVDDDSEDEEEEQVQITKTKAKTTTTTKARRVADDENDDDADYELPDTGDVSASESNSESEGEPEVDDGGEASDEELDDDTTSRPKKSKSTSAKAKGKGKSDSADKEDTSNLAPLHFIPSIFADIVRRAPQLKPVAQRLRGRKLRVATMCSGTESPLIALDLICHGLKDLYGEKMEIEHVFSCEIEPFKQAYIERNFRPPILFRDVCELGDEYATTAYGASVRVPGNVDLLVAGTSCVDYSNLNNAKQTLEAGGESGRTFFGMMSWVANHRPPLVLLENVCSAPWEKVCEQFEKRGYEATSIRLDTKKYYIPHTRQRGYLLAVDRSAMANAKNKVKSGVTSEWVDLVRDLQRPASSTLDDFLLPSDDPRIHAAREKMKKETEAGADRRTGRVEWGRCESRHQRARLEEELGQKRPLTAWDDSGFCKMLDNMWDEHWGKNQVQRVWDLLEITYLRKAKMGVDAFFKTQVWNLSQNVDRNVGTTKLGICPCLTPSMIPFITNRGGPMTGRESLAMQGIVADNLLLTRETEDNLADLAGNAMSTTVVGTCMVAALISAMGCLRPGLDTVPEEEDEDAMEVDGVPAEAEEKGAKEMPLEDRISGEELLVKQPLELSAVTELSLSTLLERANRSARLCQCEGRKDMTARQLNRCIDCGSSSCVKCGGRPEHNYQPIVLGPGGLERLSPTVFSKELKAALPMCLTVENVDEEMLEDLKDRNDITVEETKLWEGWSAAVLRATQSVLRFVEPKRQEIWAAVYASPHASLELSLHPRQPEWRLFAKASEDEPANSPLRKALEDPVARFVCAGSLFEGKWQFALPQKTELAVKVEGQGELVPAWEAKLGLLGNEFKDRKVYSTLKVSVTTSDPQDKSALVRDISGTYQLFDQCGTANCALHKRVEGSSNDESGLPPLFLLLDPERVGEPDNDSFVFTISTRKYQYRERRPIICKLDPKWRQGMVVDGDGQCDVKCYIPWKWVDAGAVDLKPSMEERASFYVSNSKLDVSVQMDACQTANALVVAQVPLGDKAGPEWPRSRWVEVDKIDEQATFRAITWLIERVRGSQEGFNSWNTIEAADLHVHCERCAPRSPDIRWVKADKKIMALEDPVQAGEFERRLKHRPAPFVTQLKLDERGTGTVRIGINVPSLLHRALARLPEAGRTAAATLGWRLDTDFAPSVKMIFPKFQLSSNRRDPEHSQPPHFKTPLRHEQLRSLGWMLEQESKHARPFIEEEIAEAILDPLGWRVEGRAQRPIQVRGGVLADEVGYGKTAITLGLIDYTQEEVKKEFPNLPQIEGKIRVKASLIIVPPHLTRQWDSEVKKFTGKRFRVETIHTVTNLNSLTIEAVQEADIVIVASNLFHGNVYLANLEAFAAAGSLPAQDGRYFNARLGSILESLKSQVERLRTEGARAAMDEIREGKHRDAHDNVFIPTKRLKGKSYREAAEAKEVSTTANAPKNISKKATATPSGLIPEVVIQSLPPSPTSASAPSMLEDEEEVTQIRPKRRGSKKAVIVLSDDEDDENKDDGDADFEVDGAMETEPETVATSPPTSDTEGSVSSRKAKPAPKKGGKRSQPLSDEDAMDVDEATLAKGKKKAQTSRKRKSEKDDSPPAKRQKRPEDGDPWKLNSTATQRDWTQMKRPPLEIFHFARKVVDEYTYLGGKTLSLVTQMTADRLWVLSGTPPIHDFGALKTISAFLNLHLGVDDDGDSQSVKKRRGEQTAVEKFHSFREMHSLEWHAHRHEVGQGFLDQFVRQNIAEIDEIPSTEKIEKIYLPAAERAIYLELEHHLRALDMVIKRNKKTESDREKRLAQALGESSTAEEALLKRCSHFELETRDKENAMRACEVIVIERTKQLKDCKAELLQKLEAAVRQEKKINRPHEESLFKEYVRVSRKEGVGDKEATDAVCELLDQAAVMPLKPVTNKSDSDKDKGKSKGKGKGKGKEKEGDIADLIWEHREQTHEIRRLTKELVGRVRSLRYFTVVRDLQKQRDAPPVVACPGCGEQEVPVEEIAVLSSCGHTGCYSCVKTAAENEECVAAGAAGCRAAARVINIVKGSTLGVDDEAREGRGKHFGLKLEKVVDLIKKRIPRDERVLIFVQFKDLMAKVAEALSANRIPFLQIQGSASVKSKNLEKFQTDSDERVLLLNVMDESASGANLTSANHAIFLSPLLAPSKEIYNACETQAIGRVRRYGQRKHVYVWRFFATDTVDEELFEQRTGRKV